MSPTHSTVSYSFPVSRSGWYTYVFIFLHDLQNSNTLSRPPDDGCTVGCRVCAEGSEGALVAPSLLISRFEQGYPFFIFLHDHVLKFKYFAPSTLVRWVAEYARWVAEYVSLHRGV